jgi:hypothetical protein
MVPLDDRDQAFGLYMRVDLRCRNVGVTEHRLHGPQVGSMRQQVAGEGVAEDVGGYPLWIEPALDGQLL